MAKSANINVRIDPETKKRAEDLFSSFGITITDAINIFLRKSIMEGGLPFDVRLPEHPLDASCVGKRVCTASSGPMYPGKTSV